LQHAIAGRYGLTFDQVVLGTGADQLIRLLALAYIAPGDHAVVPTPSFPSYATAVQVMGGVVRAVGLTDDGAMDLDALADAVDAKTRLLFLCSPNNPTGGIPDCAALPDFLAAMAERGILTVVDEAYGEYADGDGDYRTMLAEALGAGIPTVVLRTFSKVYGLAGLRIGWAACPSEVADVLRRTREIFAVSGIAEEAALAAWQDTSWRDEVVRRTQAARARFLDRVEAHRLLAYPTRTNFVAVASHPDTAAVAAGFAAHGVQVRPTDGFGLPAHIRVTMGQDHEMERFWAAFAAVDAMLPFPRR
jgi:histidinol-phosphate aminotransferase